MAFVADNSVVVAWFVKSQATSYTWGILERAAAGEAIHVNWWDLIRWQTSRGRDFLRFGREINDGQRR